MIEGMMVQRLMRSRTAASLTEYAVLAALLSVVVVVLVYTLGFSVSSVFVRADTAFESGPSVVEQPGTAVVFDTSSLPMTVVGGATYPLLGEIVFVEQDNPEPNPPPPYTAFPSVVDSATLITNGVQGVQWSVDVLVGSEFATLVVEPDFPDFLIQTNTSNHQSLLDSSPSGVMVVRMSAVRGGVVSSFEAAITITIL